MTDIRTWYESKTQRTPSNPHRREKHHQYTGATIKPGTVNWGSQRHGSSGTCAEVFALLTRVHPLAFNPVVDREEDLRKVRNQRKRERRSRA